MDKVRVTCGCKVCGDRAVLVPSRTWSEGSTQTHAHNYTQMAVNMPSVARFSGIEVAK